MANRKLLDIITSIEKEVIAGFPLLRSISWVLSLISFFILDKDSAVNRRFVSSVGFMSTSKFQGVLLSPWDREPSLCPSRLK